MIQLLQFLASTGAVASVGAITTLDCSQVTRRMPRFSTQSVTYVDPLGDPPITVLERALLVDDALGGQTKPDAPTEAAFASVINSQTRPATSARTVHGALPFGL